MGTRTARRFPVGTSSFEKICDGGYTYVDKTLFIKSILDAGTEVTLFTRPRRFGKSLNMDMLRVFFEKTNEDTARYFRDKKIWEEGPAYTEEQGKYPVIQLSFANTKVSTWDASLDLITQILQAEYERQLRKMDESALSARHLARMNAFIDEVPRTTQVMRSLANLSEILHEYYGVPPVILLDEYDTPIEYAWNSGGIAQYNLAVEFMWNLLSPVLKDSRHMSFACMTGVLRVAKEGFFSGLNNLRVDGVLDERYDEYFGFTPDEVRSLAESCGVAEKVEEIARWYQGYLFGNEKIFNPWSVLMYLDSGCKPNAYWANTARNGALGEVLLRGSTRFLEELASLLGGGTAWSTIRDSLLYPDLGVGAPEEAASEAAYTLLLMSGYLTVTGRKVGRNPNTQWELVIPNEELIAVYAREILCALPGCFEVNQRRLVQQALRDGNHKDLENALTRLLMDSVSFFDLESEREYHTWLIGLLSSIPGYRLTSNREAGEGRFDICLTPRIRRQPGVLIEVKVDKNKDATDEKMRRLATSAIRQIRKRQYAVGLHAEDVGTILEFGIAFNGKKAYVVTEDKFDLDAGERK